MGEGETGVRRTGDLIATLATGPVGTARASLGLAARASMVTVRLLEYFAADEDDEDHKIGRGESSFQIILTRSRYSSRDAR